MKEEREIRRRAFARKFKRRCAAFAVGVLIRQSLQKEAEKEGHVRSLPFGGMSAASNMKSKTTALKST